MHGAYKQAQAKRGEFQAGSVMKARAASVSGCLYILYHTGVHCSLSSVPALGMAPQTQLVSIN